MEDEGDPLNIPELYLNDESHSSDFADIISSLRKQLSFFKQENEAILSENIVLKCKLRDALDEISHMKESIDRMSDKLVDEVDKRAELLKDKELLSSEIEELTKGLFEEANGMVANEARERYRLELTVKRLQAELDTCKDRLNQETAQLEELKLKMEALILNQDSQSFKSISEIVGTDFKNLLSFSYVEDLFRDRLNSKNLIPSSPLVAHPSFTGNDWELIFNSFHGNLYKEFIDFTDNPNYKPVHPFMKRIIEEDVEFCAQFPLKTKGFARKIVESLCANQCTIHLIKSREKRLSIKESFSFDNCLTPTALALSSSSLPEFFDSFSPTAVLHPLICSLCGSDKVEYKFQLHDTDPWMFIDSACRNRLVSVADFFAFCRSIKAGHYDRRTKMDLFLEVLHLRRHMFYQKVGGVTFYIYNDCESFFSQVFNK